MRRASKSPRGSARCMWLIDKIEIDY